MPPALRFIGRVACGLLALFSLGSSAAFGIVLIAVNDPGEKGAAVALVVLSLAVLAGAVAGFRRLGRPQRQRA
jgi:uncharacterized membrane protein